MPILRLLLTSVQREAKSVSRLRDNAINERFVLIRKRPPVSSNATRRLAEDGDFGRIAAETGNVLVNPFDSSSLVAKTQVLDAIWCPGESKDVEAVGQSGDDCTCSFGKATTVVER